MTKPLSIFSMIIGLCLLLMSQSAWAVQPPSLLDNYQRLFALIQLDELDAPLLPFSSEIKQFDHILNQENQAYLNENKDLLENLQGHFQSQTLNWKLANSYKRLLVVPEKRADYAKLFKSYCDDAVAYVLDITQLPNPLKSITTLNSPTPEFEPELEIDLSDQGVTAYLVHNIADEYIEEYHFFSVEDEERKVQVKLRNLEFSGHIGSYSSDIVIQKNGQFKFIHNPYTVWQNNAKDPLNVLIAPVEETLHIALRSTTEIAIQDRLKEIAAKTVEEVQGVVDEWMAIEEAIVGGLVSELMPQIFSRFLGSPQTHEMNQSLANRHAHAQYRYLQKGIRVVIDLGLKSAIDLYRSEPHRFKELLSG